MGHLRVRYLKLFRHTALWSEGQFMIHRGPVAIFPGGSHPYLIDIV
jgi:hypothetical protein